MIDKEHQYIDYVYTPGAFIAGAMLNENLSIEDLSEATGIDTEELLSFLRSVPGSDQPMSYPYTHLSKIIYAYPCWNWGYVGSQYLKAIEKLNAKNVWVVTYDDVMNPNPPIDIIAELQFKVSKIIRDEEIQYAPLSRFLFLLEEMEKVVEELCFLSSVYLEQVERRDTNCKKEENVCRIVLSDICRHHDYDFSAELATFSGVLTRLLDRPYAPYKVRKIIHSISERLACLEERFRLGWSHSQMPNE